MFCGLVTGNQAIYYPGPFMYVITAAMPLNYKPTMPPLRHRPHSAIFALFIRSTRLTFIFAIICTIIRRNFRRYPLLRVYTT